MRLQVPLAASPPLPVHFILSSDCNQSSMPLMALSFNEELQQGSDSNVESLSPGISEGQEQEQ